MYSFRIAIEPGGYRMDSLLKLVQMSMLENNIRVVVKQSHLASHLFNRRLMRATKSKLAHAHLPDNYESN